MFCILALWQIGVDPSRMWGTLKRLLDQLNPLDDGKYLLLKDPNESQLTIFSLPAHTSFSGDQDEDDE